MAILGNIDIINISLGNSEVSSISLGEIEVYSSGSPIYGVSWTNDTATTMTRTDNSVGKTFAINSSTGAISSDFNSVFPWNETEIITDIAGNKFLHFPDMYFRIGKDANGDINSVAVSKIQGSDGNWYKCDAFDYGIYGGSVNGTLLESKTGRLRFGSSVNLGCSTRAKFRTYAGNNSETGYTYHQLDLKHKIVTMFLWWIEWATKNSSTIMTGHISGSPSSSGVKVSTGGTDSVTTPSGYNTSTWQMRYHYIEDFIGNQREFIDGIYTVTTNEAAYVTDNPAYFSDSNTNMTPLSWVTPLAIMNDCIRAFGMDDNKPFLVMPTKLTGAKNYTQAFCDGLYTDSFDTSTLASGAPFSSANANAGLSAFYRFSVSTSDYPLGGRLLRQ